MAFGLPLELLLAISLVTAVAPHSVPVVFKPAHHYDHGPSTQYTQPLFPPFTSPSDTLVPSWTLKAVPTTIYRPRSVPDLQHTAWDPIEVLGPDIEDRHTLSQLARISGNAYALPGQKNWYDIDSAWNFVSPHCLDHLQLNHPGSKSFPFGWEDRTIGFRGHVFLSSDNNTAILSIKGTTLQGPTSKKDKYNDNLLFSCCCARVDLSWVFSTVCDCFSGHWTCDNKCLTKSLIEDSLFYSVGMVCVCRRSRPSRFPRLTHLSRIWSRTSRSCTRMPMCGWWVTRLAVRSRPCWARHSGFPLSPLSPRASALLRSAYSSQCPPCRTRRAFPWLRLRMYTTMQTRYLKAFVPAFVLPVHRRAMPWKRDAIWARASFTTQWAS
jgi:hypothetical protein